MESFRAKSVDRFFMWTGVLIYEPSQDVKAIVEH